jgi:hypothetical protein
VINAWRRVCGLIFLSSRARAGNVAHDSPGAVAVHALAVGAQETRSVEAFADGRNDRMGGRLGHEFDAVEFSGVRSDLRRDV